MLYEKEKRINYSGTGFGIHPLNRLATMKSTITSHHWHYRLNHHQGAISNMQFTGVCAKTHIIPKDSSQERNRDVLSV